MLLSDMAMEIIRMQLADVKALADQRLLGKHYPRAKSPDGCVPPESG